jgi:hypothetical protein
MSWQIKQLEQCSNPEMSFHEILVGTKWKKNRFPSETGWSSFSLEIMTAEPIVNQQQCLAAHPHLKCHSKYSAQSHLQLAATAHDSFKSFKLCKLGILHKTWVTILGIVGIVSLAFLTHLLTICDFSTTQVIGACGWHLLDASPTLANQWNRLHPTYTIIYVHV